MLCGNIATGWAIISCTARLVCNPSAAAIEHLPFEHLFQVDFVLGGGSALLAWDRGRNRVFLVQLQEAGS